MSHPSLPLWFAGLILLLIVSGSLAQEAPRASSQPLAPAEALAKFQLAEPDLKIELVAAEPTVIDPVAIRFDEQGRMWVAEMRDYPLGPAAGEPPLSRIKILEDVDRDGYFEKGTVFADKLSFVTGLQPWKGGIIVTLAGRIAWMKDSDGDGRADIDETWYTGFAEQNSQLRANHPRLALDNQVYVANGLRGGVVINKRLPDEQPINLQGRDFRFDPLTGKAESISGNGQFGMCFDDWGNRFTCTNRNPVIHVVLEDRYLKLAPKIPIPSVVQDVAAAAEKSKVYPISRAWTTSNLHAGTFTAACGVHVYRGDTLSSVLGKNVVLGKCSVFTCDPTGNFVHREVMKPDGPSFTSTPAYEGKEFLASTDEWFRPVSIETGPDGCLYIVDMYRCVIEHPDFVPDELKKRPDLRLGDDLGRIWRIAPKSGVSSERIKSGLEFPADIGDLVKKLNHPNAWQRETVQRLLLEIRAANDKALIPLNPAPEKLFAEFKVVDSRPHLIRLLAAFDQLDGPTLKMFLNPPGSPEWKQALLIAEERPSLWKSEITDPRERVAMMSPTISFQRSLFELTRLDQLIDDTIDSRFLPFDRSESARAGLPTIPKWNQTAMLLRHHRQLLTLFDACASQSGRQPIDFLSEIVRLIGSQGTEQDTVQALAKISAAGAKRAGPPPRAELPGRQRPRNPDEYQSLVLAEALARGLQTRGLRFDDVALRLQKESPDAVNWRSRATDALTESRLPLDIRLAGTRLLGHLGGSTDFLAARIKQRTELSPEVDAAMVASLAQRSDESKVAWQELLADCGTYSLPIKRALIENSFRRADGPALLLEQVKAGVIRPAEIDPLRRKSLLESKDAAVKKLAEELFAALNPANRQQALEDYQPVLKLSSDAKKGAAIFEKNCSNCHRVGEIGVNVAPDISDTRTKTAAQLLADIIQPNRAIDSNFIGYQVLLKDGTTITGLLSAETSTSLTIKQPGGKVLTVVRDEVEALKATGVSLMPDGLEKNIPPEAMADLLAYLKNWRYLDGKTPLGP